MPRKRAVPFLSFEAIIAARSPGPRRPGHSPDQSPNHHQGDPDHALHPRICKACCKLLVGSSFRPRGEPLGAIPRPFGGSPDYEKIRQRVRAVYPKEGTRVTFPELGLEVLNLHHGRGRKPLVENLGLIVRLGNFKVLHVGDTEITREELAATGLAENAIDLALIPDWLLVYPPWKGMVESILRPRHLVGLTSEPNTAPKTSDGSARPARGL